MSDLLEESFLGENVGKNYILNRISKDGSNQDTGEFYVRFVGNEIGFPLRNISTLQLIDLEPAESGERICLSPANLSFDTSDPVDEMYLCLFAIDPLITSGTDVIPIAVKQVDIAEYSQFGSITVENIKLTLNAGTPGLNFSIPAQ